MMRKMTFSHSITAVMLSSVLAGGSAFAAEESLADKAQNVVKSTEQGVSDAAATAKHNIDDGIITTKVKAELLQNDAIKSGDIAVETHDGVVTLSGFIVSQDQAKHAVDVVGKVKGVVSVDDKLKVKDEKEQSLKEYTDDALITSAVKASFLTDDIVSALAVSVETQEGVVHLTGEVESQAQISQAERVAKDVDGVQTVKNDLTIKKE